MTNIPSKLLRDNNFLKLFRYNYLNKQINLRGNINNFIKDSHKNETTSVENLINNFNKRWNKNITKEEFEDNYIKRDESKSIKDPCFLKDNDKK